eukprot:11544444-Alexandrium_andersonii.AAC.1
MRRVGAPTTRQTAALVSRDFHWMFLETSVSTCTSSAPALGVAAAFGAPRGQAQPPRVAAGSCSLPQP